MPASRRGERHARYDENQPAETVGAKPSSVKAEEPADAKVTDRPGPRPDQARYRAAAQQLDQQGKVEQDSDQRAPQGGGQEASDTRQAASQKAPGDQADQDGRAGKDQYRIEGYGGGQQQPDGRNLSPEAAMASARSGSSSNRTVGGHAMGDGQATSHPGQDRVGGKRSEATLP